MTLNVRTTYAPASCTILALGQLGSLHTCIPLLIIPNPFTGPQEFSDKKAKDAWLNMVEDFGPWVVESP